MTKTTLRTYLLEEERERRQERLVNNQHKTNMKITIPKREQDLSALDVRLLEVFDERRFATCKCLKKGRNQEEKTTINNNIMNTNSHITVYLHKNSHHRR